MERRDGTTTTARPSGVLETLGMAFAAALDQEVALWRGATQSFGMAPRQCHVRPTTTMVVAEGEDDEEVRSCDSASVGVTASASHSDGSSVSNEEKSLADQWAELEDVLASLQPTRRDRRPPTKTARGMTLSRPNARDLHSNIDRLRVQSHARRSAVWGHETTKQETDANRHELCKTIVHKWREVTRARVVQRAKSHSAQLHWCRAKCESVVRAWRAVCLDRRQRQEQDRVITHAIQSHRLRRVVRQWWITSRWTRGNRQMKAWANARRVEQAFAVWYELVEMARHVKSLYVRGCHRRIIDTFVSWRRFASDCHEKRQRTRQVRAFILHKFFSALVQGTRIVREQRSRFLILRQRRARTTLRRMWATWINYTNSKRRAKMAIEWRRHCQLSAYFEAWHLLHRCVVYHKQVTTAARVHNTRRINKRSMRAWQAFVSRRRSQRSTLKKLTARTDVRQCFRHLRHAVQADRDRVRRLFVWKAARCVAWWHQQSLNRSKQHACAHAAQKIHRDRVLRHVVWIPWREAFLSKLQTKRLVIMARHHVLHKWWCRWNEFRAVQNARHTMQQYLDDMWKCKKQRWAVATWQKYCVTATVTAAKFDACTHHRHLALVKRCLRHWKLWLKECRHEHSNTAAAERLYGRLVMHRWSHRARSEKSRSETSVIQSLHRHPRWLQRSCFSLWKRYAASRVSCRQLRLFCLWRDHALRTAQVREAMLIARVILTRRLWIRWTRYTAARTRARQVGERLSAQTRRTVLVEVFKNVWRQKLMRYRQAREQIQCVSASLTKQRCFEQWHRQLTAAKKYRSALNHLNRRLLSSIFHRLHQYSVARPQAFMRARMLRIQRQIFSTWKTTYQGKRTFRAVCERLDRWRKLQAVKILHTGVVLRRHVEQQLQVAVKFYRHGALRSVFEQWILYTTSMKTCRSASELLHKRQLQRVLSRWRRELAHRTFVHELELQYDEALLRRCWNQFVRGVQHLHAARERWLVALETILTRKVFSRWRQLVEARRVSCLAADWLYVRTQQRLLHVAFDEWTHFTTIRAFIHVRERRAAHAIAAQALRGWKVYAIVAHRRRVREQWMVRQAIAAWKHYAFVCEAGREVERRTEYQATCAAWRQWRIEFWIRQSQAMARADLLRRCLDTWRSLGPPHDSRTIQAATVRHATAFDEAIVFQRTAQHQRLVAERVIHAWALAAQTSKRQRETERRTSCFSSVSKTSKRSSRSVGIVTGKRGLNHSIFELYDEENTDPNTSSTKRRSVTSEFAAAKSCEDDDVVALEFWSSRMLKTVFFEWRSVANTCDRKSR